MKWPIPSNLTPDDLDCIKIMWPNDREWRAILAGAIYQVTRGRVWNEDTGSICDVQAVGEMLFMMNFPFMGCDGSPTNEPNETIEASEYLAGYGDQDCEDCDMGCYISDLRWFNGTLQMYRCGAWYDVQGAAGQPVAAVGGVGSSGVQIPETGEEGALETPALPAGAVENIDCRKAYMLADAMFEVASVINSKLDVAPGFREWRIINALPQYTLNYVFVLEAATVLMVLEALPGDQFSSLFNDYEKQKLTCWMQQIMRDEYGMGTDEWPGLIISFAGYAGANLDPEGFVIGHFWQVVLEAMGYGTVNEICKSAQAIDIEPDCGCPGTVFNPLDNVPDGSTWAYYLDFETADYGFAATGTSPATWTSGLGWVRDYVVGNDRYMATVIKPRETPAGDTNDTLVTYIEVHSSTVPAPVSEVRSGGVWASWIDSGATTNVVDANLPVRQVYDRYYPLGQPWGETNNLTLFGSFVVRGAATAPVGVHTLSRCVIAGKGAEPFDSLDNLLA